MPTITPFSTHAELAMARALALWELWAFITVKTHSKLHGNEVADRIVNLAASTLYDVEKGGDHPLTDADLIHPQGI